MNEEKTCMPRMLIVITIFYLAYLAACNQNNSTLNSDISNEDSQPISALHSQENKNMSGCYMRVEDRDTMWLRLNQNGEQVTGVLEMDHFEKESYSGTIKGKINRGIIHAYYDYFSEELFSVKELFIKTGERKLILGTGDMDVKGDTTYFVSAPKLFYPQTEAFVRIDCAVMDNR